MYSTVNFTLLVIAFAGVISIGHALPPQTGERILGGADAASGQFTFVASLRLDGAHVCGGSIIGIKQILTAAHCVVDDNNKVIDADRISVRVGSVNQFAGGKIVYAETIAVHPSYQYIQNDVAVVTLRTELEVGSKVSIIALATTAAEEPAVGAEVTVAGWGEQSSGATPYKLQSVGFTVASEEDCTNGYAGNDESTFCLAHKLKEGSCLGDAGNGVAYNNRLVGVASFVVGACGSRYPEVFVSITHFASWIQSQL
ncbi:trypsin alpha [Ceratitis capitata]|uniref:Trypsin epsilon n=1 Tax=Ceratitis capitata TaxID=7213 RepID=W8CA14_CERCA|nr:trypsin alpha [Ceratitis capitata]